MAATAASTQPPTEQIPTGAAEPTQAAWVPAGSFDQHSPPNPSPAAYPPPIPSAGLYPPYRVGRPTNSMAIVALVTSFVLAPLGIIFGHISLSQIKRTGEEGRGLAIAGLVIGYVATSLTVIGLVFFLVVMASLGAASHRSASPTRVTTSPSPIGTPGSTDKAIKNAQVGDCIRRVTGARRRDGTSDVTVSTATCGSSSATDRVTKRTSDPSNCSGQWVRTTAYSPPIVLCLSKLR
ncbi:DUF4190 domain-containing protein [Mycobacterium vicinigordonae]|uniref:DUF4190 domain-containing protein n=2 Tax=Mycobacterium vicinigordonae TaxID=1719132 RepID=A0A7D6E3N4_9MYCO|nr:DUF4190 domain-containing protein [Mycobacterium vicinigordonae]